MAHICSNHMSIILELLLAESLLQPCACTSQPAKQAPLAGPSAATSSLFRLPMHFLKPLSTPPLRVLLVLCVLPVDVSGGGAAMSSTEEFLSLPRPPSTIPPAGSVGLVEAAAAAGPRFRPGSAVWVVPGSGGEPLKGTVGQMVSPNGAVGGQALYKVNGGGGGGRVGDGREGGGVGALGVWVGEYS